MPPRYAVDTSVAADKSRAEIERTLQRYGARSFVYGWQDENAMVLFQMEGRQIRFILPLPDRQAEEFRLTPSRRYSRSADEAEKAWEQSVRQRWRALLLVIKAKLEAVEAGITSFETEFLPHTILPDGQTVGQWLEPQVRAAYATGKMPASLPGIELLALPAGKG